jgi:hypothetical protein
MFHNDFLHAFANITHRSNLILQRDPSSSLLNPSNCFIELADSRGSTPESEADVAPGAPGFRLPQPEFGSVTTLQNGWPARRHVVLTVCYRLQIMAIPPFTCNVWPVT